MCRMPGRLENDLFRLIQLRRRRSNETHLLSPLRLLPEWHLRSTKRLAGRQNLWLRHLLLFMRWLVVWLLTSAATKAKHPQVVFREMFWKILEQISVFVQCFFMICGENFFAVDLFPACVVASSVTARRGCSRVGAEPAAKISHCKGKWRAELTLYFLHFIGLVYTGFGLHLHRFCTGGGLENMCK
jgi:hypothetical protein